MFNTSALIEYISCFSLAKPSKGPQGIDNYYQTQNVFMLNYVMNFLNYIFYYFNDVYILIVAIIVNHLYISSF